jgi:hypothetical protein
MSILLEKGQFTTVGPDEIWKIYNNLHGIFVSVKESTPAVISEKR